MNRVIPRCRSCSAAALTTFLSLGQHPLVDALLGEEDLWGKDLRWSTSSMPLSSMKAQQE